MKVSVIVETRGWALFKTVVGITIITDNIEFVVDIAAKAKSSRTLMRRGDVLIELKRRGRKLDVIVDGITQAQFIYKYWCGTAFSFMCDGNEHHVDPTSFMGVFCKTLHGVWVSQNEAVLDNSPSYEVAAAVVYLVWTDRRNA